MGQCTNSQMVQVKKAGVFHSLLVYVSKFNIEMGGKAYKYGEADGLKQSPVAGGKIELHRSQCITRGRITETHNLFFRFPSQDWRAQLSTRQ